MDDDDDEPLNKKERDEYMQLKQHVESRKNNIYKTTIANMEQKYKTLQD